MFLSTGKGVSLNADVEENLFMYYNADSSSLELLMRTILAVFQFLHQGKSLIWFEQRASVMRPAVFLNL